MGHGQGAGAPPGLPRKPAGPVALPPAAAPPPCTAARPRPETHSPRSRPPSTLRYTPISASLHPPSERLLGLRDRSEPTSSRSSCCIRNDRCHLRAGLGNGPAHLVSAARRQSSAFPCIPDLRADLQCGEPSYRVRNDPGACYRRRDRGAGPGGPDDRIADDGPGTNGGFRKQAGIAVGMIFGLTAYTESDGIFDSALACSSAARSGERSGTRSTSAITP